MAIGKFLKYIHAYQLLMLILMFLKQKVISIREWIGEKSLEIELQLYEQKLTNFPDNDVHASTEANLSQI